MRRRRLRSCLKVVKRLRVPDCDDDQWWRYKEQSDIPADHMGQGGAVVYMGQGGRTGDLEIWTCLTNKKSNICSSSDLHAPISEVLCPDPELEAKHHTLSQFLRIFSSWFWPFSSNVGPFPSLTWPFLDSAWVIPEHVDVSHLWEINDEQSKCN